MEIDNDINVFSSFVDDLYDAIPQIDEDETYRLRFSKKRKFDKINAVIDPESIIYDTESDDDDFEDMLSYEFITWRRNYIKKYKCKTS